MNAMREEHQPIPPYVPYRTFTNFVGSLRQGMPGRIDRSLMSNMSGAVQNQMLTALRYLSLIDEQGSPQELLIQLANTEGTENKRALKNILQDSYTFLFNTNGFNLANATWGQFEEQFKKKSGASGDSVRKCIGFFLAAAQDAEIPLSPRIIKAPQTRVNPVQSPRQRGDQTLKKPSGSAEPAQRSNQPAPAVSIAQSPGITNRTVKLRSGGELVLSITANLLTLDKDDREFVFNLIETVEEYEQESLGTPLADEPVSNAADEIPF